MISGFGVEHLPLPPALPPAPLAKRDYHSAELGVGATAAGTGAFVAHNAAKDLRRTFPLRRATGVLHGALTADPAKVAHHVRGARRDLKHLVALRHSRDALAVGAAGLGVTALGTAVAGRQRHPRVQGGQGGQGGQGAPPLQVVPQQRTRIRSA